MCRKGGSVMCAGQGTSNETPRDSRIGRNASATTGDVQTSASPGDAADCVRSGGADAPDQPARLCRAVRAVPRPLQRSRRSLGITRDSACDEPPQPGDRRRRVPRVAVVDPQAPGGAVLLRLRDVGTELLDDEAHPGGRQVADPFARLRVGGVVEVRAEERVDELCRRGDYADTVAGRIVWSRRGRASRARRRLECRHSHPRLSR
jgi:hypothetical protein